ncbi:MAG: hypothetical protein QNK37_36575 [Acidobacteriota bacterium]|nr:hypothetical protein [Acidobacteriota bacterium]
MKKCLLLLTMLTFLAAGLSQLAVAGPSGCTFQCYLEWDECSQTIDDRYYCLVQRDACLAACP